MLQPLSPSSPTSYQHVESDTDEDSALLIDFDLEVDGMAAVGPRYDDFAYSTILFDSTPPAPVTPSRRSSWFGFGRSTVATPVTPPFDTAHMETLLGRAESALGRAETAARSWLEPQLQAQIASHLAAQLRPSIVAAMDDRVHRQHLTRDSVGAALGGVVGILFGVEYAASTRPWGLFVYPPFFGVTTAVSVVSLLRWLSESMASPHLAPSRAVRVREVVGAGAGMIAGAIFGLTHATATNSIVHYYVFPYLMAFDMMFPSLYATRWLMRPTVTPV